METDTEHRNEVIQPEMIQQSRKEIQVSSCAGLCCAWHAVPIAVSKGLKRLNCRQTAEQLVWPQREFAERKEAAGTRHRVQLSTLNSGIHRGSGTDPLDLSGSAGMSP